jgi:hypothetical protein
MRARCYVGLLLALSLGCGDDNADDCAAAEELTQHIAEKAQVDRVRSEGLCLEDETGIAERLRMSPVWSSQPEADIADRAHQYFVNCGKANDLRARCED